jgi:LmbE family N-acetylglucosaminyl deacetylase
VTSAFAARRAVVLSAHLDDAVFSLGAAIARAVREGTDVLVVTAFAGNPDSEAAAGSWDRSTGFAREGAAAAARRREDEAACGILGAASVWLPFREEQYGEEATDDAVWAAIAPHLSGADAVLVPGYPLDHADHAQLARLSVSRADGQCRVGLYAEQPYATWAPGPPGAGALAPSMYEALAWRPVRTLPRDRRRKWRACLAYRSQLRRMLRESPALPWRVGRYERRAGGELVAWTSSRNVHR